MARFALFLFSKQQNYDRPHLRNAPFLSLAVIKLVKSKRTPDHSLFLQFPPGVRRSRAFDEFELRRPRSVDAPTVVHQLPVDRQRKVVFRDDLVVIADIRHGDYVV